MGKSYEREGFFGKYTEHYDDNGNKIGESRERDGVFGKYTEHTDGKGNKIGESRDREGFFGAYREHTDTSGRKTGESRDREGFLGDYTEHTDRSGRKIGESREREGFFGRYTEHQGTGYRGGGSDRRPSPRSSASASYRGASRDPDRPSRDAGRTTSIGGTVAFAVAIYYLYALPILVLLTGGIMSGATPRGDFFLLFVPLLNWLALLGVLVGASGSAYSSFAATLLFNWATVGLGVAVAVAVGVWLKD